MDNTHVPFYPSTYERISNIIGQYGPDLKTAAHDRMLAGISSNHSGRTVDMLGIMAGVSRNTITAVNKLLSADLPEIISYHLRAGGMTINNGTAFLRLSPENQIDFAKRLKKAAPENNALIYNRQKTHTLINRLLKEFKDK